MFFKFVSLENFGIIKRFSKQFDKNIFILSGENGEGKSSVVKAILLAVFDDYKGVLSDYVNWDSNYFQVIVNFTHRGVDYESTVRYESSTDRTFRFGNNVLKGDEAKRKLKEIVDVDLLKAGMLAMEQKISIVETSPAERREYLKRIYAIEFKRQLSDLENDIKASELELAKKVTLQTEIENRKYSIPDKPEYPFEKKEYDLIKVNLKIEREKLHAAEDSIRVYRQIQSELSNLEIQFAKLSNSIDTLTSKIDLNKQRQMGLPEAKNKAIVSETIVLNASENELKKINDDFIQKKYALNTELNAIILERLPVFSLEDFNAVSQDLYSKKNKLTELQSVMDICPTCGQSISSPEHTARRKEEIVKLEKTINGLMIQFSLLSEKKSRRELVDKTNLERTNRKTDLQHQIAMLSEKNISDCLRIQAKIDQSKGKLDRLDTEFEAENSRLSELVSADTANKNNLNTQLENMKIKIHEFQEKLSNMTTISLDEIKERIQKFEKDIHSYDDVSSRLIEIERMEKQIFIQQENDIRQLDAVRIEIQVLNQLIEDWKLGVKVLKTEFPVYVISRVIKDIEKSMNEFLKRTYPKYRVEVQDKKNALRIVYGPKKKDVSLASGFEQQVFSLSFMYAISHAIGNKCLLLDEADSQSSDSNSEKLYNVIGSLVEQKLFTQLFVISHKPLIHELLLNQYDADIIEFKNGVTA